MTSRRPTPLLLRILAGLAALWAPAASSARAESHGAPAEHEAPAEHGEEAPAGEHGAEKPKPLRTDVFELGEFKIKNTLTANHVTVEVHFAISLVLSSKTTLPDVERLVAWKQRLRDQAIVAVRSSDPTDFADPQLMRLRRLILLRLHRLATPAEIIGVYLTDFAVDKAG